MNEPDHDQLDPLQALFLRMMRLPLRHSLFNDEPIYGSMSRRPDSFWLLSRSPSSTSPTIVLILSGAKSRMTSLYMPQFSLALSGFSSCF